MSQETSVLEPDNIAPEEETPSQLTGSVETDESQPVEAAVSQSPLTGLGQEDILKLPEVDELLKGVEARLSKSFDDQLAARQNRAQREAESRAYEAQVRRASEADVNWGYGQLLRAVQVAQEKGENLDPQQVKAIAAEFENRARTLHVYDLEQFAPRFVSTHYPEFRIPPDHADALIAARNRGDIRGIIEAVAAQIALAQHERSAAWAVQEYEKELKAKENGKGELDEQRKTTTEHRSAPRPTPAGGTGAASFKSLTTAQIEAMPMREWNAIPEKERERLLEEAFQQTAKAGRR